VRVLRRRDFRLLFWGQSVSVLGTRMVELALAFAVLEVGGSVAELGVVLAAHTLGFVISVLAGGVVADRSSRRAVMIGADLLRLVTQGCIAVALLGGFAEVWMLGVLSVFTGIGGGFFGPAATGLLPEVVPPDELQQANALRSTASSAGEIGGPILAGVLVAAAGPGWAFAVDAGTFAASAVWLSMLGVPGREPIERTNFLAELRDGWRAFSSRSWVWSFVLYFAIGNMFWHAFMVLGPVVADRDLGGAAAWGAVLGAFGVGALVGSLLAVRAEPDRPLVYVALTEGLFMLPLAFLAATEVVAVLAAGSFLAGMGMMLGESVWESTLQRHVPGETLSRVSSYDWFGSMAFTPIGLAAWGPIAAVVGISTSLWIAFGLMAASVCALLALPAIRQLPAFPPSGEPRRLISPGRL